MKQQKTRVTVQKLNRAKQVEFTYQHTKYRFSKGEHGVLWLLRLEHQMWRVDAKVIKLTRYSAHCSFQEPLKSWVHRINYQKMEDLEITV